MVVYLRNLCLMLLCAVCTAKRDLSAEEAIGLGEWILGISLRHDPGPNITTSTERPSTSKGLCHYAFTDEKADFESARVSCISSGGSLALVKHQSTHEFIEDRVNSQKRARQVIDLWIGGVALIADARTQEKEWRWMDNTIIPTTEEGKKFSEWYKWKPEPWITPSTGDEYCLMMSNVAGTNRSKFSWHYRKCVDKKGYVCESPTSNTLEVNRGNCMRTVGCQWRCECEPGYHGERCEEETPSTTIKAPQTLIKTTPESTTEPGPTTIEATPTLTGTIQTPTAETTEDATQTPVFGTNYVHCAEGAHKCSEEEKCCPSKKAGYYCCPDKRGVCCEDLENCCHEGWSCGKTVCYREKTKANASFQTKTVVNASSSAIITTSATMIATTTGDTTKVSISSKAVLTSAAETLTYVVGPAATRIEQRTLYTGDVTMLANGRNQQQTKYFYETTQYASTTPNTEDSIPALNVNDPRRTSDYICTEEQTGCPHISGGYFCCPFKRAVCCMELANCCIKGSFCGKTRCYEKLEEAIASRIATKTPDTGDSTGTPSYSAGRSLMTDTTDSMDKVATMTTKEPPKTTSNLMKRITGAMGGKRRDDRDESDNAGTGTRTSDDQGAVLGTVIGGVAGAILIGLCFVLCSLFLMSN